MAMETYRPRGLRRWDPFREMEDLEREFLRRPFLPLWSRFPMADMAWAPSIDMIEKADRFLIKADLPGMKMEDIDLSVVGDTLTIKGEKKAETETKEEEYYFSERTYGSFSRSMTLPASVEAAKIEATYDNGVLEINLPKAPEVKAKKVSISAAKKEKSSK